jgi:hypothetical protein
MIRTSAAIVLLALFLTPAGFAVDWERILIPLAFDDEINGSFGSRWIVQLVGRNDSERPVRIFRAPDIFCILGSCPGPTPEKSDFIRGFGIAMAETPRAVFLYVEKPGNEQVSFNLRVQDVCPGRLLPGVQKSL